MKAVGTLAAVFCLAHLVSTPTSAQVDPSGDWRTWHTEHFRIHAKAEHATHVSKASREAERAYAALSSELRPPKGRIDFVLNDAADFSNGFATIFPSNRVTVNLAPPSTSSSLGFYDDWLRLVIMHELAHIFHLDRSGGVWGFLQKIFGRAPGLFPNTYQPGWVSEGIATYYESKFSSAGRVRGTYHTQLLGAAARDGSWPNSGDAVRVNPTWPAGKRPYAWGGRFFESQRLTFGDSVVSRFVERTSRQLIVFNVSSPMKGAGGESVGDGWRRLEVPFAAPRGEYRVLQRGLRAEPIPRVSPDGTRVGIRRVDGKSVEKLVVLDIDTGDEIASRRVSSIEGIAWVGDTLYVTQLDYSSPVTIRSDLYRWAIGDEWTRVSADARYSDVFAAGDGRVGLVRLETGSRTIHTAEYPDTAIAEFPAPASSNDWGRISISPNGEWVVAARHANQQWDIVVWPAGRPHALRMVTDDATMDADPVWDWSGETVLFTSEKSGIPQIYEFDLASGSTVRVTDEPAGARHPAPTDDGRLLYSTVYGDGYALIQRQRQSFVSRVTEVSPEIQNRIDAPSVPVRETRYTPWPALRPHFWMPIGHDEGRAGAFVGAITLGTDPIRRTTYGTLVAIAPENGRFEAVAYADYRRWKAWSLDVAASQTWDYDPFLYEGAIVPASFRERTVELGLNRRWRRWRSAADVRLRGFVERDVLVNEGSDPLPFTPRQPTFGGGGISASISHFSRPSLSISPENGIALQSTLLGRWHLSDSHYWSSEMRARGSGYVALPLPGFSHWILAASVTAGRTGGTAPTSFSVGGESGDLLELIPGMSIGSGRRRFQMRGYPSRSGFTRAVVAVLELRIPAVQIARGVPRLPLFLDRVSANLFGEVGSAWIEGDAVDLTAMRDIGAEVAIDLGLGAGFAVRTRLGGAVALIDWLDTERGSTRYYVAFGRAF